MAETTEAPAAPNIVAAAGTGGGANIKAHMIEDAMAEAVMQCAAEGITDADEIRKRKLAAREKMKRGES